MSIPVLSILALAAAAGAALSRLLDRRLAGWGLLAIALGLASVAVATGGDVRLSDLGTTSAAVDGGLVVLGTLLLLGAGLRGWTGPQPNRIAPAIVVIASLALGALARPLVSAGGLAAEGAALLIGLAGAAVVTLGAAGILALSTLPLRPAPAAASPTGNRARALAVIGAAAAVAGPSAWIVVAGALIASLAPTASMPGSRRIPLLPLVAAAGLMPVLWFMHTVAGPIGLAVATLAEVPFSPAAEVMIAPVLALGAYGFFALWPLGRWSTAALVPVGVALLLRLGAAVPAGMEAWQTVLVPVGVIAAAHASLTRRPAEALSAGAWLACVSGGAGAAVLLAGAALMLVMAPATRGARGILRWGRVAAAALGAAGGALALESLLRSQVVYTVVTIVIAAVTVAVAGASPSADALTPLPRVSIFRPDRDRTSDETRFT